MHVNGTLPATGALHVLVPIEPVYTVTPGLSTEADIATDTTEVDTGVTITPAGAEKYNANSIIALLAVYYFFSPKYYQLGSSKTISL